MNTPRNPQQLQEIYQQALEAHDAEDYSRAITLYTKVAACIEDGDVLFYNLGVACFQSGDTQQAIFNLKKALELTDGNAEYWFTYAQVNKQAEDYIEAIGAYKKALALKPDDREILYSLGCCCKECGIPEEAEKVFSHILELFPHHVASINQLAYLAHIQGKYNKAEQLYKKVLAYEPDHMAARYMLKVLKGEKTHAPPAEYVRQLFDNYSTRFEQHLQDGLEYNVPNLLYEHVTKAVPAAQFQQVLDLGCGTGLCGELFRDKAVFLTGVDISAKMIEVAREKGLYDALEVDEIVSFLKRERQSYDLFLAADVFIYIGDLMPAFTAIGDASTPGTYLCFSVENTEESDWKVQPTGRFAHSHRYIAATARQTNFELVAEEKADLRKEKEQFIEGTIFLFRYRQ